MDTFKEQVRLGFQACKGDIALLNSQNIQLKDELTSLKQENFSLKSELSEIKSILLELKTQSESKIVSKQPIIEKEINLSTQVQPDPYEALLAFKAKTNKRDMLKKKMVSMVGENGMMLNELKFMIVDHFRYCSKASFYNYLKELELEHHIKIERENTKNIVYLTNSIKREI